MMNVRLSINTKKYTAYYILRIYMQYTVYYSIYIHILYRK